MSPFSWGASVVGNVLLAAQPSLTGAAFNEVLRPHPDAGRLLTIALGILGLVLLGFVFGPGSVFGSEVLAQRLERDARDEVYLSLLGKSQTFHNRQRVGDIMARAANDVRQLNPMINPGINLICATRPGAGRPHHRHRADKRPAAARAAALRGGSSRVRAIPARSTRSPAICASFGI